MSSGHLFESGLNVDDLVEQLVSVAKEIRLSVEKLDASTRRKKTTENQATSNQYYIDVLADEIVHERLNEFPGYILSEEKELDKDAIEKNKLVLVVDPIDGSTNASRGIGYWSFAASLVVSGQVQVGVVVDQVSRVNYIATSQDSAYVLAENGDKSFFDSLPYSGERLGNRADNFAGSLICFNSHEGPNIPFRHLRHFGSSALAICDAAKGGLDAYIDDENVLLRPWDLLAAEFIAKKAGAIVLRRDSQGVFAATGVLVSRSEHLIKDFENIFPHFFRK